MSRLLAILIGCFFLAACGDEIVASDSDKALVEQAIRSIEQGDKTSLSLVLDATGQSQIDEVFPVLRRRLPDGGIKALKLVRAEATSDARSGLAVALLDYEVSDGANYALVSTAVADVSGRRTLVGLGVDRLPASVEAVGGFSLSGQAPKQYLFLAVAIASPLIILTSLILMFRAGPFPRRRLWAIGSVAGIGMFAMNWYSGETQVNPVYLLLMGFGFWKSASPAASWVLMFGFPLVAILFLALRPDRSANRVD